jgi:hypothetical protein
MLNKDIQEKLGEDYMIHEISKHTQKWTEHKQRMSANPLARSSKDIEAMGGIGTE